MTEQVKPKIFLSHYATGDARIANDLADVIRRVFAGAIECWFSSDQSPAGGFSPGAEWYQKMHQQLSGASRVLVLVTPSSIGRPWIYWESGIGSVTCPGHVVPIVFGLAKGSLEPPLNYFQAVDGLDLDDLVSALAKVAEEEDLSPDPGFLREVCESFINAARDYITPGEGTQEASPEEKMAAMLMGPLQNIQRRLEPLEFIVRRLDMLTDENARPTLRRPSARLRIHGVPVNLIEDLIYRGEGSPYLSRMLRSGELSPGQVMEAVETVCHGSDISPEHIRRAEQALIRTWEKTQPAFRAEESPSEDDETDRVH